MPPKRTISKPPSKLSLFIYLCALLVPIGTFIGGGAGKFLMLTENGDPNVNEFFYTLWTRYFINVPIITPIIEKIPLFTFVAILGLTEILCAIVLMISQCSKLVKFAQFTLLNITLCAMFATYWVRDDILLPNAFSKNVLGHPACSPGEFDCILVHLVHSGMFFTLVYTLMVNPLRLSAWEAVKLLRVKDSRRGKKKTK